MWYNIIGFSEVLAADVQELGINVTVVAPSGFRTGFLSKQSLVTVESAIEAYRTIAHTHDRYKSMDGNQSGDPEKISLPLLIIRIDWFIFFCNKL